MKPPKWSNQWPHNRCQFRCHRSLRWLGKFFICNMADSENLLSVPLYVERYSVDPISPTSWSCPVDTCGMTWRTTKNPACNLAYKPSRNVCIKTRFNKHSHPQHPGTFECSAPGFWYKKTCTLTRALCIPPSLAPISRIQTSAHNMISSGLR